MPMFKLLICYFHGLHVIMSSFICLCVKLSLSCIISCLGLFSFQIFHFFVHPGVLIFVRESVEWRCDDSRNMEDSVHYKRRNTDYWLGHLANEACWSLDHCASKNWWKHIFWPLTFTRVVGEYSLCIFFHSWQCPSVWYLDTCSTLPRG